MNEIDLKRWIDSAFFVPLKTENSCENLNNQYSNRSIKNIHINVVHILIDYCKIHIDKMSALHYVRVSVCVCVSSLSLAIWLVIRLIVVFTFAI